MPSLNAKDRAPLCLFSYEDHRRCRTPRIPTHPHFCFYHAQKESQSQSASKLAADLAYFFSGDYLTANDLNTAMARLIPATIRGEIKPRLARTLAYMLQTLFQSLRLAQHEYINAFGTDGWRQAIATSVNNNQDYRFPESSDAPAEPASQPSEPATPTPVGAGLVYPEPRRARPDADVTPTPNACHPDPACPEERRERSEGPCLDRAPSTTDETHHPTTSRPSPAATDAALNIARALFPERPNDVASAFRGGPPSQPEPPAAAPPPPTNPTPATPTQTAPPNDPPPPPQRPAPTRQTGPGCDPYAVHYDHTHRLYIDGKPWDGKPR